MQVQRSRSEWRRDPPTPLKQRGTESEARQSQRISEVAFGSTAAGDSTARGEDLGQRSSAATPRGADRGAHCRDNPTRRASPTRAQARGRERPSTPPPQRWEGEWGRRQQGPPVGSEEAAQVGLRPVNERWIHPKGQDITQFWECQQVQGRVTNVAKNGVFVDIGGQKDGLLPTVACKMRRGAFKVGEWVSDLEIKNIDLQKRQITLGFTERAARAAEGPVGGSEEVAWHSDSDGHVPARRLGVGWSRPPASSGGLDSDGREDDVRIAPSVGPRGDAGGDLQIGGHVTGKVKRVTMNGVFIDIGAHAEAWLPEFDAGGNRFRVGETVSGLQIGSWDGQRKRIVLRLLRSHGNSDVTLPGRRITSLDHKRSASPMAWKGSTAMWTEGNTGGTRGTDD